MQGSESTLTQERDYSGFATAEVAAVYDRYIDTDLVTFASRIGMDERDLKKIVQTQNYTFTGLRVADEIVIGLGQNVGHLIEIGELHVVPARDSANAARRIVEDEYWVEDLDVPTESEMEERIAELLELRRTLCIKSPEQEERLRRDSQRSMDRQARLRANT